MNISEGFIKRPIATSLLMAAIALFGMVAYRSLPVSDPSFQQFPSKDDRSVTRRPALA